MVRRGAAREVRKQKKDAIWSFFAFGMSLLLLIEFSQAKRSVVRRVSAASSCGDTTGLIAGIRWKEVMDPFANQRSNRSSAMRPD